MNTNPLLGVALHWIGGLAAASFYLPYRGVKRWSWETYWLVGGVFSWIIAPWVLALVLTRDFVGVLSRTPPQVLLLTWFFGIVWGVGGLTFGLAVRYLGMSLGYGLALGICAVCGTLIPPLFNRQLGEIMATSAGQVTLAGILICVIGIMISALSGLSKERELSADAKAQAVEEFNFKKGTVIAVVCGLASACFAFGLASAAPMAQLSAAAGTPALWTGLPKLVVILCGGFTTNVIWCVALNVRNGSWREYASRRDRKAEPVPLGANFVLCAVAGVVWYFQFFFYTMGETQMGRFQFSSWTLHMASIIIFSTLWGVVLKEWRGTSRRTHRLIASGIGALILSTLVVGFGNYLAAHQTVGR